MRMVVRRVWDMVVRRVRRMGMRAGAVLEKRQAREAESERDADHDASEVVPAHGRTLSCVAAVTRRASMTVRTVSTIVGR